ncbi:MAG: glycogen synthase GlgA [Candidatus Omnitrophica bacterium]|nr:glycogen synthase GlgA [Candidatus Omnitrophota bacterium]
MKILFCSSEMVPFAKTGGLADVSGALPQALEKKGCLVKVALPKYKGIKVPGKIARLGEAIDVFLIENEQYFNRSGLYGEAGGDYDDNLLRFSFFCQQVLDLLKQQNFCPDIIHCNDWQSALIPVYLKTKLNQDDFFKQTKTIFTIHNLAYQGLFAKEQFPQTNLDWSLFNMQALEFYNQVNLLKGGLLFADFITTVSPTYAQEIQLPKFGCGLDGVLRQRKENLSGIINGLDYTAWNPATDDKIFQKYGPGNLELKAVNKKGLQRELNLTEDENIPLFGIVTRLAEQKGIELIISALEKMAKQKLQFVLLGTGDNKYHEALELIKQKKYKNFSINLRFDATLAQKIYAGCDIFLMPSNYEPCGLGQLISLKYGTIPVVRKTGGLADTVEDYQSKTGQGNGFVFEEYSGKKMFQAIERSMAVYKKRNQWLKLMRRAMQYDFSWAASAEKYIKLYRQALNER